MITVNLLRENIHRTCFDTNHSKFYLDPPLRVMKNKSQQKAPHGPKKHPQSKGNPKGKKKSTLIVGKKMLAN